MSCRQSCKGLRDKKVPNVVYKTYLNTNSTHTVDRSITKLFKTTKIRIKITTGCGIYLRDRLVWMIMKMLFSKMGLGGK